MSRRKFIESHGATCKNWNWSWSFVNHAKRFVIFGAWDNFASIDREMILDKAWHVGSSGRKNSGYQQSLEHIQLIENEGYRLFTFTMIFGGSKTSIRGSERSIIESIIPVLKERRLVRFGTQWYAAGDSVEIKLPEEVNPHATLIEGAKKTVTINAYERSSKARAACVAHHGATCAACSMTFGSRYGADLGDGYIHVHHIVSLSRLVSEYQVDPIKDLIPVCPNCHAMLHKEEPPMSIEDLRKRLQANS